MTTARFPLVRRAAASPIPWLCLALLLGCALLGPWAGWAAALGAALAGGTAGAVALGAARRKARTEARRGRVEPHIRRALRSREAGRPREALEDLDRGLAADPDSLEAAVLVWELSSELGHRHGATQAGIRVIDIELRRGHTADALAHWKELTAPGIPLAAPPRFLQRMAVALRESGNYDEAVFALRCALERSEDEGSRELAARIARAARGLDAEIVETAAWRALGSVEIDLDERQALEELIAEVFSQRRTPRG